MQPHGLWPISLLCPWDSPGKNTGMGCHALLQGIFPVQGANLHLLHCGWFLYDLHHQGSPMSREIAPAIGCATGQWFVCHHRRETSGTNATDQPPGEWRRGGMEGDAPLARIFFFCAHGSLGRKMMIIPMLEKRKQGKKEQGLIPQRGSQGSGSASAHLILMRARSPTGPGGPGPRPVILWGPTKIKSEETINNGKRITLTPTWTSSLHQHNHKIIFQALIHQGATKATAPFTASQREPVLNRRRRWPWPQSQALTVPGCPVLPRGFLIVLSWVPQAPVSFFSLTREWSTIFNSGLLRIEENTCRRSNTRLIPQLLPLLAGWSAARVMDFSLLWWQTSCWLVAQLLAEAASLGIRSFSSLCSCQHIQDIPKTSLWWWPLHHRGIYVSRFLHKHKLTSCTE